MCSKFLEVTSIKEMKSLLKTIATRLRHQAVYSKPFHVITFCDAAFRGIKVFRCLVPITTTEQFRLGKFL